MPIRRTSNRSSQDTGFYTPEVYSDVGSRNINAPVGEDVPVGSIAYSQSSVYIGTSAATNGPMTDWLQTGTQTGTNSGVGQWIKMDLGATYTVDRVVVGNASGTVPPGGWGSGYTNNLDLQYSLDDSTWTTILNTGDKSANGFLYTLSFSAVSARYIRLITPSALYIALTEFYALAPGQVFDPSFSYVSLLLHMNGTDGSTTFTDSSSNAITVTGYGNAQISTAQSKFGGASAYFDGSGDYLLSASSLAPLQMGTGDFTVEAFIRPTSSVAGYRGLIGLETGDNQTLYILSGQLVWYSSGTAAGTIAVDTWYHVATSRQGTNLRTFIDGVLVHTSFNNNNLTFGRARVGSNGTSTGEFFQGWMDELRITKGIARYTANFTPPTAAFPDA